VTALPLDVAAQFGSAVRVTGPSGAVWQGILVAYCATPCVVLETKPGSTVVLPAAYDRTLVLAPGGDPAPGHRALRAILRDAVRAKGDPALLGPLREEYDAAAGALFGLLGGLMQREA